jgi:hypothetical protein
MLYIITLYIFLSYMIMIYEGFSTLNQYSSEEDVAKMFLIIITAPLSLPILITITILKKNNDEN